MADRVPILQVFFCRSENGNEPVREWLKELRKEDRRAVGEDIKMKTKHIGGNIDDFLKEQDMLAGAEAVAAKRVLAFQIEKEMKKKGLTKVEMASRMRTSRTAVDRLLDPANVSVTLNTLEKAALVLGKKLSIRLA